MLSIYSMETETKVCAKCRHAKKITDFTQKSTKDTYNKWCNRCLTHAALVRLRKKYERINGTPLDIQPLKHKTHQPRVI